MLSIMLVQLLGFVSPSYPEFLRVREECSEAGAMPLKVKAVSLL